MDAKLIWSDRRRLWCGLPWTFTTYRLTEDRLFVKSGFLNLREDEVRLYRIKDLVLRRSLLQRMFGLGTIQIISSDSSLSNFELSNIKRSSFPPWWRRSARERRFLQGNLSVMNPGRTRSRIGSSSL